MGFHCCGPLTVRSGVLTWEDGHHVDDDAPARKVHAVRRDLAGSFATAPWSLEPLPQCQGCWDASEEEEEEEEECAYCGVTSSPAVPAVDDDASWSKISAAHGTDCEWARTRAHRIMVADAPPPPQSLDELLDYLRGGQTWRGAPRGVDGEIDWSSLPTYGGPEPVYTWTVWSWDETRLMVGTCADDLELVERHR